MASKRQIVTYWASDDGYKKLMSFKFPDMYVVDENIQENSGRKSMKHFRCFCCSVSSSAGSGIEIAHIVPKSIGGSNDVDNLFLLCRDCHRESPDCSDDRFFFKWVSENASGFEVDVALSKVEKISKGVSDAGGGIDHLRGKDLLSLMSKAFESIQTHGGRISDSTYYAVGYKMVEIYKEQSVSLVAGEGA